MPKERCMLGYDGNLENLQVQGLDPRWVWQFKYDGNRGVTEYCNGTVHIIGRSGEEWTDRLPEMVEAIKQFAQATGARSFKIDGEIVCFKDGHSHLPSSNSRVHTKDRQKINLILRRQSPVTYIVFDLLEWESNRLPPDSHQKINRTDDPFTTRDLILGALFEFGSLRIPGLMKAKTYRDAATCWQESMAAKEEGIMGKQAASRYIYDRDRAWLKIKAKDRGVFKVVGYTEGNGSREELFGALILANRTTGALVGRCGGGFTEDTAEKIMTILSKEPVIAQPFPESEVGKPYTAVATDMLVEVAYQATDNYSVTGKLRSPQLIGFSMEKPTLAVGGSGRVEAMLKAMTP